MKKKQSMKERYHEHSGEERRLHGHHKPKSRKKAFSHFMEEKLEEKVRPGIHKAIKKMAAKRKKK